jgi:hypothetical protein
MPPIMNGLANGLPANGFCYYVPLVLVEGYCYEVVPVVLVVLVVDVCPGI